MYATESLRIAMPTLPLVVDELGNLEHRTKMLQASLFAGLAISNTRTALAHSISYPLTLNYGVPHGLACSFALPAILRFNAEEDDGRIREVVLCLGYSTADDFFKAVADLIAKLGVRNRIREYAVYSCELEDGIDDMLGSGRSANNLRPVNNDDVLSILKDSVV